MLTPGLQIVIIHAENVIDGDGDQATAARPRALAVSIPGFARARRRRFDE